MAKSTIDTTAAGRRNPFTRVLMFVLAITVMPLVEAAKALDRKVYSGFAGGFRAAFGVLLGLGAGIGAAYHVGWAHDAAFWQTLPSWLQWIAGPQVWRWLPAGLIAAPATYFYIWPVLYLLLFRPVITVAEHYWDAVSSFAKKRLGQWTTNYIGLLRKLPVADQVWNPVLSRDKFSWFTNALHVVYYPSVLLGSAYIAWKSYLGIDALITVPVLGQLLGAAAGLGVLLGVTATLWTFLKHGKIPFLAIFTGVVAIAALAPQTALLVAALGLSPAFTWAAYAVEFLLYTAYLYPIINLALTSGFWRWVIDQVKPLMERVYDEDKTDFRRLLHHSVNLLATAALTLGSVWLSSVLSLPLWGTIAASALAGALSYLLVAKALDHDGGNYILGVLSCLAAGFFVGQVYFTSALWFGAYGAITAGVTAAALTFCVIFPLLYSGLKLVSSPIAGLLSKLLVGLHEFFWGGFKKLMDQFDHVYDYSYRDKSPFKEMFLHVANLAATAGIVVGGYQLATAVGFGPILSIASTALAVVLGYLLLGKLILKTGTGFVGTIVALAAGVGVGALVAPAQSWGLALAIPVGIAVFLTVLGLLFPLAYIVVRALTNWALTYWLRPLLAGIYDFGWRLFVKLWLQFVAMYRWVKKLLTPVWVAIVSTYTSISRAIKEAWESLRGKR